MSLKLSRASTNTVSRSSVLRGEIGEKSIPKVKTKALTPVLDTLRVTGGVLVVVDVVAVESVNRGLVGATET